MAKRAKKKRAGKKRAAKKKRTGKKRSKVSSAARTKAIKQRISMHNHAAALADFHGGRLPVKSGCGRPRKK